MIDGMNIGDEVVILYGSDKGRIGKVDRLHLKDIIIKFSDKQYDGASFRYHQVMKTQKE